MSRIGSGLVMAILLFAGCNAGSDAAPVNGDEALRPVPTSTLVPTPEPTAEPEPTPTVVPPTTTEVPTPELTSRPTAGDVTFYPITVVGTFDYPEQGLELVDNQLVADAVLTYIESLNVTDHTVAAKSIDVPAFSYLEPRLHPEIAEAKRMIFADAQQRDLWAKPGERAELVAVRVEPVEDFREFVLVFCEHVDLEMLNSAGEVQITEVGTVERRVTFVDAGGLHVMAGFEPTNVVLGEWTGCPDFFA